MSFLSPVRQFCSNIPQRWIMCALCCSAGAIKYFTDTLVGETIAMLKVHSQKDMNEVKEGSCPFVFEESVHPEPNCKHSDPKDMRHLSQLYEIAYLICQLPASVLTYKFSTCKIFGLGMVVSAILNLLFPFLANKGAKWIGIVFFLQGAAKSVVFPCIMNLAARWSLVNKRSTFLGIIIAGVYSGRVLCHILFQLVIRKLPNCFHGFYIGGGITLAWCLVWFALAYDSPQDNACVSEKEKVLLEKATIHYLYPVGDFRLVLSIPWNRILTNKPFLCLLMVYFANDWTNSGILFKILHKYTRHILHLPMKLATLSPVLMIAAVPSTLLGGVFSDWLVDKQILTNTNSKRIFIFLGTVLPPTLMLFLPLTGCNRYTFLGLFVSTLFLKGMGESSINVSSVDLSPQHAGLLMAIVNLVGTASNIFSEELIEAIVTKPYTNKTEWIYIFIISTSVALLFSMPHIFLGSGNEQPLDLPRTATTSVNTGLSR